jgi:hypothetical protein
MEQFRKKKEAQSISQTFSRASLFTAGTKIRERGTIVIAKLGNKLNLVLVHYDSPMIVAPVSSCHFRGSIPTLGSRSAWRPMVLVLLERLIRMREVVKRLEPGLARSGCLVEWS